MGRTVITNVGMVCSLGSDPKAVMRSLNEPYPELRTEQKLPIECGVPASKLRRINRYSKLALCGAMFCLTDEEHAGDHGLCYVERFSCAALEGFPIAGSFDRTAALTAVKSAICGAVGDGVMPDVIFDAANSSWFDEIEKAAITEVIGVQMRTASPKK